LKSMLKEVKIVTYVRVTLHLISTIACRKRKEHKLSTHVFILKFNAKIDVNYNTK